MFLFARRIQRDCCFRFLSISRHHVRGFKTRNESEKRLSDPVEKRLEVLKQRFQALENSRLFANSLTREKHEYETLESEVNEHMRAYKNIHQVPSFYWPYFIYFFTFYPNKLKLILRLVDKQPDLFSKSLLITILAGLIRFNHDLRDTELTRQIERVNEIYFKSKRESSSRDVGDSAYRDVFYKFLLLNSKQSLNSNQLDFMLTCWSNSNYIPDEFMFRNMKKILNKDRWSLREIDPKMYKTIHTQLGLSKAHFDPQELHKVADKLKENELQVEYDKELKLITFDQMDKILAESDKNFKYVVDGMNVLFYKEHSLNVDAIHKLVELIKGEKSLIIMREHVKFIKKELYLDENVRFVFLRNQFNDDRFVLYSALKSSMCNDLHLITMDRMSNHTKIDSVGYTLQRWLMQKRIDFNDSFTRLLYIPECEIKVQRASVKDSTSTWFIPVSFSMPEAPDKFKYYVLRSK